MKTKEEHGHIKNHKDDQDKMNHSDFQLTVLGARGSMPVCRADSIIFGGNTSCYMVKAGDETVFLDAGTGLINAPVLTCMPPVILLSHLHLDHVLGLGMYPRLTRNGMKTKIYISADTLDQGRELLNRLYGPPYWPVYLEDYAGQPELHIMPAHMQLGDLTIESLKGNHPGESLIFRLQYHGKKIVYATDYEYDDSSFDRLAEFCTNAELLLYDAQFTENESRHRKGFGHSTPEKGIELMERAKVKQLLLIHHDPQSTDNTLKERERELKKKGVSFAREGETINL